MVVAARVTGFAACRGRTIGSVGERRSGCMEALGSDRPPIGCATETSLKAAEKPLKERIPPPLPAHRRRE